MKRGIAVSAKARELDAAVRRALGPIEAEAFDPDSKVTLAEVLERRARVLKRRAVEGLAAGVAEALRVDRDL